MSEDTQIRGRMLRSFFTYLARGEYVVVRKRGVSKYKLQNIIAKIISNNYLCYAMMNNVHTISEAKAWVKRKNGPDEVVSIVLDTTHHAPVTSYLLYTAYAENPDYLGRILFDTQGYWIYDGELLTIAEQEQLARFIINYVETV